MKILFFDCIIRLLYTFLKKFPLPVIHVKHSVFDNQIYAIAYIWLSNTECLTCMTGKGNFFKKVYNKRIMQSKNKIFIGWQNNSLQSYKSTSNLQCSYLTYLLTSTCLTVVPTCGRCRKWNLLTADTKKPDFFFCKKHKLCQQLRCEIN